MNALQLMNSKWVLALALLTAGCAGGGDMLGPNQGRVQFVLGGDGAAAVSGPAAVGWIDETGAALPGSDALDSDGGDRPHPRIKAANVTFSSILARSLDGVLENVDMDLPVTVDIVTLETGRQIPLPDGALPTATYDQVVVVMTQVQIVLGDDTTITIAPPGGGWTAIAPLCPAVSVGEGTATVSLTLEVRNAFFWLGNRFRFEPRFRRPFGCAEVPPPPTPPTT